MQYLKQVTTLMLDTERCIGCGRCAEVCPHQVFGIDGAKMAVVDRDSCMECGACARNCPAQAIAVRAGVGCAAAVIIGWLTRSEPHCDCSDGGCC